GLRHGARRCPRVAFQKNRKSSRTQIEYKATVHSSGCVAVRATVPLVGGDTVIGISYSPHRAERVDTLTPSRLERQYQRKEQPELCLSFSAIFCKACAAPAARTWPCFAASC